MQLQEECQFKQEHVLLEKPLGERGVLIGGAPGVTPGNVLILGGGVVGENAAIIATGMQAKFYC